MSIRFSCPSCKSIFTVSVAEAGTKTECNVCGQRIKIPAPQKQHTVLGEIVPNIEPTVLASPASTMMNVRCPTCGYESDAPAEFSGKRANCPRCETAFLTNPPEEPGFRLEKPTSAVTVYEPPRRRLRERDDNEEEDYRPRRRRRRRRDEDDEFGFRCPFCRTQAAPYSGTRISTAGWITFAILLALCWPLFWIGLLITEPYSRCSRCGGSYG